MLEQVFVEDKTFVTRAFNQGKLDYEEIVGALNEREFFRDLMTNNVLERLAEDYPTPRKKEEVPLWLYLASEISLRLHGAMGFGAYPYVLHCGGLVGALGPSQVRMKKDPHSGEPCLVMEGFNRKNHYARTTPCDKDYLRKLAKDTDPQSLENWFGMAVVQEYKRLHAFDYDGIFLVDGSYIFVPLENKRYENSSVLWFDGSGHPVSKEKYQKMSQKEKERCKKRRCYRMVTLSHTTKNKDYSLRCGTTVMSGRSAEVTKVWPLVDRFTKAVGEGVMKLLIFDRGLIDGVTISRMKDRQVDSLFPLKVNMDVWKDAKAVEQLDTSPWQRHVIAATTKSPAQPDRPSVVSKRESARQKTITQKRKKKEDEDESIPKRKLLWIEYKWIDESRVWEACSVPIYVLLIKNHYENEDVLEWALASTRRFSDPLEMWKLYKQRDQVEEDHRQEKQYWDLTSFRTTAFSMIVNRIIFVQLTHSLLQLFLRKTKHQELVGSSRQRLLDMLLPQQNNVVLYCGNKFAQYQLLEFTLLVLRLPEGARRRLIGKVRQLRHAQLAPPDLPLR